MGPRLAFLCLVAVVLTPGCASTPELESMSPAARAKLGTMKVYPAGEDPEEPFIVIKTLKGVSCRKKGFSSDRVVSEEEATEILMRKGADLGAEAIINVVCRKKGSSLSPMCKKSVTCIGEAVMFSRKSNE
jgi:hypothetical protein